MTTTTEKEPYVADSPEGLCFDVMAEIMRRRGSNAPAIIQAIYQAALANREKIMNAKEHGYLAGHEIDLDAYIEKQRN